MSTVKTSNVQVGRNAAASQNFILRTNADGTLRISRGELGALLGDVLAVDAGGKVTFPADPDFAIIYPNGGSEGSPANVSVNTRYVESNPFPGYKVICKAEIFYSGEWVETGWWSNATSNGSGVRASQIGGDSIVVRTAATGLILGGQISGSPTDSTSTSAYSTPSPCRVLVWKVKGAAA